MPTRLQLARNEMFQFFEAEPQRIHKQRDLERILSANRATWRLAESMPFQKFLKYLLKSGKLHRIEFPFPHRKEIRYSWSAVPLELVLLTLRSGCHFSHYTAVQLHELTEQDPRTIYLNSEQCPKPVPIVGLAQDRIDRAFRGKPRTTRNVAPAKGAKQPDMRVCLLNGKHTGYLGVEEREVRSLDGAETVRLRLTDLERTLIDIAVRPFYAGGVAEVLKAYRRAAKRVSVNRIAGLLRKLNHVYPYHQAIGFYLDAAGGYDEKAVALFHDRFDYEFDFFLTYGLKDSALDRRWRIYVPKEFKKKGR
ncbi:MAG: hypothetical protein IID40_06605 [Planctomycetes bacterium]|nr:hypothetical protein [Planctomycetota bacterium]